MMSQYVPSGRPVVKVRVCADDSLSRAIHASGPRENAIRFVPSVYQLATGSLPASARLCQATMFATPVIRSVQYQPLLQFVLVTYPLASAGGESLVLFQVKLAYTCGVPKPQARRNSVART